jgi:uncharacterized protein YjdB
VATISGGTVSAVGGGTAIITATSTAKPGISAVCTVTVTVPLVGINLPSTLTMGVGSNYLLPGVYNPLDTTETGLDWSSSDTSVATVSGGTITAVSVGTTTITATSTNGIKASCTVTVQATFNGAGVNIEFRGFYDETITLDTTVSGMDELVITAPSGFDRYLWYMDNTYWEPTTTPVLRYPVAYIGIGLHYITVIVDQGGYHFSKTLTYTVGY